MKSGIIYKATSPSGKVYIGKTIKLLERRKSNHLHDSKLFDCKFYRAISKYGFDNFKWEIIANNIPENRLDVEEILAIYLYDSYYSRI
jgi:group I intron endonuclease